MPRVQSMVGCAFMWYKFVAADYDDPTRKYMVVEGSPELHERVAAYLTECASSARQLAFETAGSCGGQLGPLAQVMEIEATARTRTAARPVLILEEDDAYKDKGDLLEARLNIQTITEERDEARRHENEHIADKHRILREYEAMLAETRAKLAEAEDYCARERDQRDIAVSSLAAMRTKCSEAERDAAAIRQRAAAEERRLVEIEDKLIFAVAKKTMEVANVKASLSVLYEALDAGVAGVMRRGHGLEPGDLDEPKAWAGNGGRAVYADEKLARLRHAYKLLEHKLHEEQAVSAHLRSELTWAKRVLGVVGICIPSIDAALSMAGEQMPVHNDKP
jgi:hypothetical protein